MDFAKLKGELFEGGSAEVREIVRSSSLSDLRHELQQTMVRDSFDKAMLMQVKQSLFNALAEASKVELPNAMVDQEIASMQQDMQERMRKDGQDPKNMPDFPREYFEKQAQERVKPGLAGVANYS